jgi:hypothetical protein
MVVSLALHESGRSQTIQLDRGFHTVGQSAKVTKQSPKPGMVLAAGSKVSVKLG